MLGIGKFSKLSGLSNKTLIWYDQVGLLKPDYVNPDNGYRYYSEQSLDKVMFIQLLQALEFSINDIKNLSTDIIESKLKLIDEKIHTIQNNIHLLDKLKESDNMLKTNLNILNQNIVSAKWSYECTVDSFEKAVALSVKGEKDDSMPQYLFFGQTLATDLDNMFKLGVGCFENEKIKYNFVAINERRIAVYSISKQYSQKNIKFHIYSKDFIYKYSKVEKEKMQKENEQHFKKLKEDPRLTQQEKFALMQQEFAVDKKLREPSYTDSEIKHLYNKYFIDENAPAYPLMNLVGKWEICDEIYESEIAGYEFKQKKEIDTVCGFQELDIMPDNTVYVMKEGDTLSGTYTENGVEHRVYKDRENTKGIIKPSTKAENQFVLQCGAKNRDIFGTYKQNGNEEYLFINAYNFVKDLNVLCYCYRKIKD